jgi:hypothetical protein
MLRPPQPIAPSRHYLPASSPVKRASQAPPDHAASVPHPSSSSSLLSMSIPTLSSTPSYSPPPHIHQAIAATTINVRRWPNTATHHPFWLPVSLDVLPSNSLSHRGSLSTTRAVVDQAPVSFAVGHGDRSTMDHAPLRSTAHKRSPPKMVVQKHLEKFQINPQFYTKALQLHRFSDLVLGFEKIQSQPTILHFHL